MAPNRVISKVKDNVTGHVYSIESAYLFGCDGARGKVVRQLGIPFQKGEGQGLAFNVLVEVDLSEYMKYRMGNLHFIVQPDLDLPSWSPLCIVRMVKPWHE